MIGGEKLSDNTTEEYWSRFPDTYDKKMEYVVGKELRDAIIQELNCLPELGELVPQTFRIAFSLWQGRVLAIIRR
jgi:hypothetical protein